MVYIHSGNAESSGLEFDGSRLAAESGAMVVTLNNRLGILGLPELGGSTNFGFALEAPGRQLNRRPQTPPSLAKNA